MYIWFGEGTDKMKEIPERYIFGSTFFLEAPSIEHVLELIEKRIIKKVEGNCTKATPCSKIKMGVKCKFLAGDPIKFEGELVDVAKLQGQHFAKIMITEEVFFYSYKTEWITSEYKIDDHYLFLQLLD